MSISRPGSDDILGQALVANGTMSQDQLDFALMLKDAQPDKYLGEILIQIGIPQEKINKALYYSNKRKTIGEILIDQGLISSAQLEDALSKQRHIKKTWELTKTLGQLLIEMGYINSHGLLTALSKQFNMPILSMKNYMPNPEFQNVIGKRYAREQKILVVAEWQLGGRIQECCCLGKNARLVYGDVPAEQAGVRNLISGAYAVFRNPRMHRIIEDDENTALIIIGLIDLMMRIVDDAVAQ